MDSENKTRISLYLDKKLVQKADKAIKEYGYNSRNEIFAAAMENLFADQMLKESESVLCDKLAAAVANLSEDNARAISKGLFRYAVQLEMVMRMIATLSDITEEEVETMRHEAVNNVRRTRGKVHLKDIIAGHYNE